eukprot:jgi/Phyca11/532659/estExt2_fgenesh1_pg.C_PHYCAscaffold_70064
MQALLGRIVVAPTEPAAASPSASSSVSAPSVSSTPVSPRAPPANALTTAKSVLPAVKADIALAVEGLQFATLLGERKKAVQTTNLQLKSKSLARPLYLQDTELMEAMLELLQSIVGRSPSAALLLLEQPQQKPSALTVAPWGMQTSLTLLQDPSPWIRGPAIALVRVLQEAQPGAFAKAVLECKEGLRRLLEVVEDRREHIRDAALTVLGQLTGRDKNAQQFLAFEEGFARLFQIMEVEGLAETGASPASTVIADCLQIVNNMLRDNLMTQTLFLEMPYLESHVPRILRLSGIDGGDEEDDSVALGRRKRVLKLGLQLALDLLRLFLCEDEEEQALKIAAYDISDADDGSKEEDEAHYLFMLYERAFTIFYRETAEQIQKRVIAIYTGVDGASTSVDSGAPNAVGAYQDLIRMQDKQIHELQRKVDELSQREVNQGGNSDTRSILEEMLTEQLETQRKQFEQERAALESKIKTMSEAALEMETRVNGLTMAYEQLEQEHQQHQDSIAGAISMPSSTASEQLAALQAELEEEREANRRLRAEAVAAKGGSATQALREKSDAELATVRLMKQLEELRVESERKDEQLVECNQMLETLTKGQTLVKNDNEKLKAQLVEALSQAGGGETAETELKGIIDGLRSDKEYLEHRVEELEAAARAAYEKDQEVLQQRIQEVEQARRATPPVTPVKAAIESALPINEAVHTEVNTEDQRLKELVSSQLEELKGLRALVVEMESVAREREAKVQQASFLQELVAGYDVQSRRDKEKYDATIRELEDELARAFLEKKDAGRKAKAAVKELENEVARLFLAKVELEKELGASHTENGSTHGSFRRSIESDSSNNSTVDDLLVLVASLEIQCSVLRDTLKESQGEDAVAVAVELSRQRGAVVSV